MIEGMAEVLVGIPLDYLLFINATKTHTRFFQLGTHP